MTTATASIIRNNKLKEYILNEEIIKMLENPNPLTGIYSIYGDYPIEKWKKRRPPKKKLEIMRTVR